MFFLEHCLFNAYAAPSSGYILMDFQEENEECRIFAAAKRKMMRLRAEKEREIYV